MSGAIQVAVAPRACSDESRVGGGGTFEKVTSKLAKLSSFPGLRPPQNPSIRPTTLFIKAARRAPGLALE